MSKITLPTVASGYNLSVINSNFQAIEDTLNDSVLFRDEDVSNEMSTNLDMNGFSIYNVNEIDSDAVTVGGVPLAEHIASLAVSFDPNDLTIARYVKTITIASTIVTLPETYGGTASSLMVFRNGVQQPSSHYAFDGSNITFSDILGVGEVVDVVYFKSIVSAIGAAEIGDVSGLTEALAAKQATLVSGVNIRTINGNNILGGGDLSVGAGTVTSVAATVPTGLTVTGSPITSSGTLDIGLDTGYSIPTTTKQSEWDAKQAALVSGTNIKTINGSSVLGSGNLVVAGTGDVAGPASSTDNTLPRFDGTTGKVLQGSTASIGDDGKLNIDSTGAVVMRMTRNGGSLANSCQEWFNGTNSWYAGVSGSNFWGVAYNTSGAIDNALLRLDTSGNLTLSAGTLGYGVGAGGTVTQVTSKSTDVTLNKPSGRITMHNAALASGAFVAFYCYNTFFSANDTVIAVVSGATPSAENYSIRAAFFSGAIRFVVQNTTGGSLSEAVQIQFTIIKGSTT